MQAYNSSIIAENVGHYAFSCFLDLFGHILRHQIGTKHRGKKFPLGSSDQVGVPIGLPDLWGFAHGPWARRWACSTVAPSAVRFMSGRGGPEMPAMAALDVSRTFWEGLSEFLVPSPAGELSCFHIVPITYSDK